MRPGHPVHAHNSANEETLTGRRVGLGFGRRPVEMEGTPTMGALQNGDLLGFIGIYWDYYYGN